MKTGNPGNKGFMEQALGLARQALSAGEVPVGAVVVLDGEVVGRGRNAMIGNCDPTAHAEVEAIRDAAARLGKWRLDGASIYVTLEPCPMCAGAIMAARIGHVVYGAPDPRKGAVASLYTILSDPRLGNPCKIEAGVLKNESLDLLKSFFAGKR